MSDEQGRQMRDAQRASRIRELLLAWFDEQRRDLPWRRSDDPYRIWVSEIMLQQTQVERVVPYYERFLEAFPTVHDLAGADVDEVLRLWEGLGYYSRARNLHRAACMMVEAHGGRFPRGLEEALALPGVGRYTAGAILSIAYHEPVPAVDANAARVLARLFAVDGRIDGGEGRQRIEELAQLTLSRKRPGDFNQALMELGAMICTAGRPGCLLCPATEVCAGRAAGRETEIPPPGRAATRRQRAVAGVIRRDGRVLVAKRDEESHWPGLWEFPAVILEGDQRADEALREYLAANTGLEVAIGEVLAELSYGIMNRRVDLTARWCEVTGGETRASGHERVRWMAPEELPEVAMPSPHRALAEIVQERMAKKR
ncbi:MAG: A/G-specific adenine glycosylase [Armatimonadota bacterium]|nr:A/G-specific adenine glycosylase [Armatimonadota bacterium]